MLASLTVLLLLSLQPHSLNHDLRDLIDSGILGTFARAVLSLDSGHLHLISRIATPRYATETNYSYRHNAHDQLDSALHYYLFA